MSRGRPGLPSLLGLSNNTTTHAHTSMLTPTPTHKRKHNEVDPKVEQRALALAENFGNRVPQAELLEQEKQQNKEALERLAKGDLNLTRRRLKRLKLSATANMNGGSKKHIKKTHKKHTKKHTKKHVKKIHKKHNKKHTKKHNKKHNKKHTKKTKK